ncbi:hypothetical protein AAVH_18038 [Aphelenchoides avenae]|nr:hypothetical protein AAVH_18038 [Aphelenchus avenae]
MSSRNDASRPAAFHVNVSIDEAVLSAAEQHAVEEQRRAADEQRRAVEEQHRAADEQRRAATELALVRKVRELTAARERMADELEEKDELIGTLQAEKWALEEENRELRRQNDRHRHELANLKRTVVKREPTSPTRSPIVQRNVIVLDDDDMHATPSTSGHSSNG